MRSLRRICFCCALGVPALAAPAQEQTAEAGTRPRAAERIVRVFDFEERLTNPLDVPDGWVRAQHDELVPRIRPSFPIWNQAELDYQVAWRGEGSVRVPVSGGSASLRLEHGGLPIFPLGEYAVRAMVRTEGVGSSRPRMVVRALDARGEAIEGSERETLLEDTPTEWTLAEVRLPGLFKDAAFLQIDLELVQAREFRRPALRDHQVWEDDFDAAAWFDDVVVLQMPQVALETGSALNVVTRPERPVLKAQVRDLAAEGLTATLRVFDATRRLVDFQQREISTGRLAWEWEPALPGLGWYRAVIDVQAAGRLISSTACDFVWLEEAPEAEPRYERGPRFSGSQTDATPMAWRPMTLELSALPPGEPDALAEVFAACGASWVSLPIWEPPLRERDMPERVDRLKVLTGAMRERWIEAAFALPALPEELASLLRLEPTDVLGAIAGPDRAWERYLLDAMDRLGTVTAQWQVNASGDPSLLERPTLASDVGTVRTRLERLVPGIELALGWRVDAPPPAAADGAAVEWPEWMPTVPTPIALRPWTAPGAPHPLFVLEPITSESHTERAAAADLARRTVELWRVASGAERPAFRAGLRDPWRIESGEKPAAHPTAALAAWRALADRLDGRVFGVEWPLIKGVRCIVFVPAPDQPERGGMIALWNVSAPPEDAELIATLGTEAVRVYDVFGNSRLVEPTTSDDGARFEHRIPVGPEPVFIEGINTGLVLFLTSVALDPPEIQSVTGEHEHAVLVRNHWPTAATGRVVVSEPGGYDPETQARDRTWDVTPRTLSFDLQPGAEARLPVVITFSRSTEAGAKSFVFDVHVVADRDYGWVRARSYADLTWNDVWLDVTFRPAEGGADLVVEATVTNTGERPRSFEAVAFAPGMPRARASIGTLQPGQSVVRRFPFPDAYDALAGQRVLVSLAEPDGPGRLTKAVEIPPR